MSRLVKVFWVVIVLLVALLILQHRDSVLTFSKSKRVEITTTPGAKVFAKLPDGEEQFLNSIPESDDGKLNQITMNVPIDADIILRYDNNEEIIAYEKWQEDKSISHDFNDPKYDDSVSIQINAVPWAYVFIKLPGSDDFIKPRPQDFTIPPVPNEGDISHSTPIPGGLKVPIGTTIKLVYQGKEKVFPYRTWKEEMRISHIFSDL